MKEAALLFQQIMNQTFKMLSNNTKEELVTPIRMKAAAVIGNIIHNILTNKSPKYKAHSLIKKLKNIT